MIARKKLITIDPDNDALNRKGLSFQAPGCWLDLAAHCNSHDSLPDDDQSIGTLPGTDVRVVRRLKKELAEAGMIQTRFGVKRGCVMSGCTNIPSVLPYALDAAFNVFHYTEHKLECVNSNGDLAESSVRYVEGYGCDPNDPSLLDHLPGIILDSDFDVRGQEAEDALARARFFLSLLRRPGGLRYGILYEGPSMSDCDIANHTYSVAATAPCCMRCGFDAKKFDDLWRQAGLLALAPSGLVWGQSLNSVERTREWAQ
jgi:hypothetical protein